MMMIHAGVVLLNLSSSQVNERRAMFSSSTVVPLRLCVQKSLLLLRIVRLLLPQFEIAYTP